MELVKVSVLVTLFSGKALLRTLQRATGLEAQWSDFNPSVAFI